MLEFTQISCRKDRSGLISDNKAKQFTALLAVSEVTASTFQQKTQHSVCFLFAALAAIRHWKAIPSQRMSHPDICLRLLCAARSSLMLSQSVKEN